MKKTKKILLFLVLAFLGGLGIVAFIFNKPHTNVSTSKADINISAQLLVEDFETDETVANTKYLEKIVKVSGIVSDLSIHKEKGVVTLDSNGVMGNVLCHFSLEETREIMELEKGMTISVKGICTGYLMDVVLVKCVIN